MGFPVRKRPADFFDEDGALLLCDEILSLFPCPVRPSLLKLRSRHEGNRIRKLIDSIRPLVPDFMLHMLYDLEN